MSRDTKTNKGKHTDVRLDSEFLCPWWVAKVPFTCTMSYADYKSHIGFKDSTKSSGVIACIMYSFQSFNEL